MPLTQIDFPILQTFFCSVEARTGMPPQPLDATPQQAAAAEAQRRAQQDGGVEKPLPKGVVLGPDGKPCKTCTSSAAWKQMMRGASSANGTTSKSASSFAAMMNPQQQPAATDDCPPDVEQLGRSTWTLLHTMTANYPERPSLTQQTETKTFLQLFSKYYPCWVCADDFRSWMKESGNEPKVSNREEFGRWMCEAHNAVNVKLGKKEFDCGLWEERWRTGWRDGRCD